MNKYIALIKEISLNNKYTKYYYSIVEKALLRPQDREELKKLYSYVELHHILPKCFNLGGEKDNENLVFLTAKEHFVVHLCATKMFESSRKNKMVFAFRQLRSSNLYQHRYMNSRLYNQIKPQKKAYIRIYKEDKVKYIHREEKELLTNLYGEGWSPIMTEEFKKGRVGNMKGRTHSQETKDKMSKSSIGKLKLYMLGRKQSKESIQKAKDTKNRLKLENPEKYRLQRQKQSELFKQMYREGKFVLNGMKGKHHSDEFKKEMSERQIKIWKEKKSDPEAYAKIRQEICKQRQEYWKDNDEARKRHKIYNSKAYKKYDMMPQDFYNSKLKPLLYLGFLPTSIVRYGLLDMCAGSIKRLVYEFGDEQDKQQFEENKRKMAGANKSYIKFLEEQYIKHFKPKTEESNPGMTI